MSKRMLILAIALFAMAGVSQATSILWVSDYTTTADPKADQDTIDWLTGRGYTVDRFVDFKTMTAVKQATANSYDLLILNGNIQQNWLLVDGVDPVDPNITELSLWHGITTPILNAGSVHAAKSTGLKWFNNGANPGTTTSLDVVEGQEGHYVFQNVTPDENNLVAHTTSKSWSTKATSAGNGTIIALRNGTSYIWLAEWPAGVEFYTGSGVQAGRRMWYSVPNFESGLTLDGKLIYLNAVYNLSGATHARPPFISAGGDAVANINETVSLSESILDISGGGVTKVWTYTGPGTATINTGASTVSFDTVGAYELTLTVHYGGTSPETDTVNFYVRDPANDTLIAHYDFEGLPDPNTLVDVTANIFDGVYDRGDPNNTDNPTLVSRDLNGLGTSTSQAWSSTWDWWDVTNGHDQAIGSSTPDFNDLATSVSVMAWIKMPSTTPAWVFHNWPCLVWFGPDKFQVTSAGTLQLDVPGGAAVYGTQDLRDDTWHHVVGIYDGPAATGKAYVDGILQGEITTGGDALFKSVGEGPLIIGNRWNNGLWNRPYWGQADEIKIYNYAISEAQIAAEVALGDIQLTSVEAGDNQSIVFTGADLQLDGTVLGDDGKPVATTYLWELTLYPSGADPNFITINTAGAEDTSVTFPALPVEGAYTFQLTADDTVRTLSDSMVATLTVPTCEQVIADGLNNEWDRAGAGTTPDGPDCRVDIKDFAAFAAAWLDCTDPLGGAGCTSPY